MGVQRAILPAKSGNSALAPLHHLLTAGGDNRIEIDPRTGANTYGCTPYPVDEAHVFSSSTASSISAPAYAHISRVAQLAEGDDRDAALRHLVERSRASLVDCLALNDVDAEVIFAPSGTDAQLHVLFLVNTKDALTTITVGADQTGSGTVFTSKGLHFAAKTARGCTVEKGTPIAGLSDGVTALSISLVDAQGKARAEDEVDAEVCAAVEREVRSGRKVLLQAMDASKFGWRAPSDRCLETIRELWPEAVQIVIDACQMRISRLRLKAYLARGFVVLVTGSKFFTGPAFSGAVLAPRKLLDRLDLSAAGLEDYARQSDYAPSRRRATLDAAPNPGQWLRWEAALVEMRNYYALPAIYRKLVLARLAKQIPDLIAQSQHLKLLPAPISAPSDLFDDEEMAVPTIFPFLMETQGSDLGPDDAACVYRALMQDLSDKLPSELASVACHIGQPVKIASSSGSPTAAVRICIGARTLSLMWSSGHRNVGDCVDTVIGRIRTVVQKTDLIVAHLDQLRRCDLVEAAPSSASVRGIS
jgi:hypothetical protein